MSLGILLVLVLTNPLTAHSPTTIIGNEPVLVRQNSLIASKIPPFNAQIGTLASLIGYDIYLDPIMENKLILCLIEKESQWDLNAVGDTGKAIGLLQFHQETFDMFSKKYNLDLDIYNPSDQIRLADLMLKDNPNNIWHWTTAKFCLSQ